MRVWVSIYMLTNDKALLTFSMIKKVWELSILLLPKYFIRCSEINSHENRRSKSKQFQEFFLQCLQKKLHLDVKKCHAWAFGSAVGALLWWWVATVLS